MRKFLWTLSGICLPVLLLMSRGPAVVVAQQEEAPLFLAPRPGQQRQVSPAQEKPPSPYQVTPQVGPWMIFAAHYHGQPAEYLAEQVVRQLRLGLGGKKFPAYTYNFADRNRWQEQHDFHRRMQGTDDPTYKPRFTRVEEEVAVLIGGFRTAEDANRYLEKYIRKLPPPEEKFPDGSDASLRMTASYEGINDKTKQEMKKEVARTNVNPFQRAFVVRNPSIQLEQQGQKLYQPDPFWKRLNADEPYSLLNCKRNYTLVIKNYEGPMNVESLSSRPKDEGGFLSMLGLGRKDKDAKVLALTALQAHELARVLRQLHFEAYVLHMRNGSLVTVGSWDKLTDDEVRRMREKIGQIQLPRDPSRPDDTTFELMNPPLPMPVPRL
jgi:hypothetical protein